MLICFGLMGFLYYCLCKKTSDEVSGILRNEKKQKARRNMGNKDGITKGENAEIKDKYKKRKGGDGICTRYHVYPKIF